MKDFSVRDQVQQAAVELFATKGYANTSVQEVVEAAGVTKGAMYHYYRSKDDLLFGIYERLLTLQQEHLDEIIGRGMPVAETLRAACVDVIETSIEYMPEGTVFFRSMHMLTSERHEEVMRRRRRYNDDFVALIERGQQDGVYRTDIPRAVLMAHFFSDLHYLSQWYNPSGPESGTEVAEQLTELFLDSLTKGAGS
ncbi:TetR/AcrR family transcriptional regulator [Agromyces mangrovi Wang et al. 2018]|uniref:TetR/AcrR family transcriptional regulator n=1 Tax=Agromyces mangrovi TaxID=1858653 RepID=UPI002573CB4F|nr:TetR/AcrR family transcriptional regulator [Agromyces mangrovi]BDZ64339.1 hypothetical protein GCM10025877_12770 [Agromyces mangrovi]